MHAALAALVSILRVLAIWTAVSVLACAPLVAWFRAQARRNVLRAREDRRKAWAAAASGQVTAR